MQANQIAPKKQRRVNPLDQEVQGWFLTWPRCPLEPKDVLLALQNAPYSPGIKDYVIAREKHADGTPHIHAFIRYDRKIGFRHDRWTIQGYKGHYEAAASWSHVQKYVAKDGDYISNFDVDAARSKKAARNTALMTMPILELLKQNLITPFQVIPLINNLKVIEDLKCPVLPRCEGFIPNTFGLQLPILAGKRRHYWFWSASPDKGKTTFLKNLSTLYCCYLYNVNEKFQEPKNETQFLLFDEYSTAKVFLTDLNSMCDSMYKYPRKNMPAMLLDSPIVIICGNRRPEDVYTNPDNHDLIKARFNVFCLD